jgi:AhpD family alkylhydroperoxidase
MRLSAVKRPPTVLGRLMTLATRRALGRAITPAEVVYNRVPRAWNLSWALVRLEMKGMKLDGALRLLVKVYVSQLNGCTFCEDIARAMAVRNRLGTERFAALADPEGSSLGEREKAALAFAREAARLEVSDATFERLRDSFEEREIAELTLCVAIEQFYNTMNVALDIPSDRLEHLARA